MYLLQMVTNYGTLQMFFYNILQNIYNKFTKHPSLGVFKTPWSNQVRELLRKEDAPASPPRYIHKSFLTHGMEWKQLE